MLGEIHDCDVMLPRVERHLAELREQDADAVRARAGDADDLDPELAGRAPHRTAYRGLEVLAVYLRARRKLLFDRFAETLGRPGAEAACGTALERSATKVLREARERRRAAERAAEAERQLAEAEREEREAAERAREAAAELAEAERASRGALP